MLVKLARRAAGPITLVAAVGLWPAQAAYAAPAAAVRVPCSTTALASAIGSATSGETLTLAFHCTYRLTAGLPAVTQNLTITGNHATLLRSTAPATPAFTILPVNGGTLALSNLNFTNGNGAISITGVGNLTVQGGIFSRNKAANGGAIYCNSDAGNLSVTGATFTGNTTTGDGGAIDAGQTLNSTPPIVAGDTFTRNTAGQSGGAILDFSIDGADISDSAFDSNQAAYGGAIASDPLGGENLTDVSVRDNRATQDGGGIDSTWAGLTVTNGKISGNHAGGDGGGIYQGFLQYGVGPDLTGTSVQGNSAENGGGIYNNDSVVDLTSSTVEGNRATDDGAGIYNFDILDGYGDLNLAASTVSGNKSGADGGGIYTLGPVATVTAKESQIVHNAAVTGGGGIYEAPGTGPVTLTNSPVLYNKPDNCEPPGSITDCTG
jgi:predicted outer membrane repeat protein